MAPSNFGKFDRQTHNTVTSLLVGICRASHTGDALQVGGVAVKLRSLCWQNRFEQGYCREAEGPEQQREAESVIKSPEKGRVLRVARKRRADSKHVSAQYQC